MSAILSRKRKEEELMNLQNRVHSLENEVKFLRDRLRHYEPVEASAYGKIPSIIATSNVDSSSVQQFNNNCNFPSLEPAVFKI